MFEAKVPNVNELADVIFSGLWDGPAGYSEINRCMMRGFEAEGINVCLRSHRNPYRTKMRMSPADCAFFDVLQRRAPRHDAVFINSTIPHGFIDSRSGHRIGLTMFESIDTIPDLFRIFCNKQHELWLPSKMCVRAFKAGGVDQPIHRMPLGVDVERFRPGVEPYKLLADLPHGFRIGCNVGHSFRKGYDVLLRAYYEAFTSDDDVCLIYKGYYGGSDSPSAKERVMADLREVKAEYGRRTDLPAVQVFADCIDADEMPGFYTGLDVLCTMTRGEGFFMPGIEAMASGIPNIVPAAGAFRDFMDKDTTLFVEVDDCPIAGEQIKELCHLYDGLRFVEPSHEDCAVKLRWAFEHRDELRAMGQRARKVVAESWTWERANRRMAERLRVIFQGG